MTKKWAADEIFMLVVLAVILILRILIIPRRLFDPDELEHAHAAWSVFRGQLPYRDFFEHHTPWYYYLLSPFFRWFAVDQSFESARRFLSFARGLSLVLTVGSAALIFLVGRLGASRKVGLLSALFLVSLPVVIEKTLEIRPDVPALPFFIGGLWFLLHGLQKHEEAEPWRLGWFLGGGLCFGGAIMCTQKALFVLPGAFTGLGLWALAGGRRRLPARSLAVLIALVGVALPFAITWGAFAVQGGGAQFIRNNFTLNARWKLHSDRHVLVTLETSWPMLIPAAVGVFVAVRRFIVARPRDYGDVLLLGTLGGLIAGIVIVPAAYRQYYLLPLAIGSLYAARGLVFLVGLAREPVRARLLIAALVPLLIWPAVDLGWSLAAPVRRNDRQMARLRYVYEHTAPSELVLDGWLGTAVFRPHPLYYFFMHRELLAMLSDQDIDAYLGPLESGKVRPVLITVDDEMLALGPRFLSFVRRDYTSTDGLFYHPVGKP